MDNPDHFADLHVTLGLHAENKRQLLKILAAESATRLGRSIEEVLEVIQNRENLGSTALGKGVALPHAHLTGSFAPFVLFARLDRPINFDARDTEPVDLLFLVLWPSEDIKGLLPATRELCRALRDATLLRQLRLAETPESVIGLMRAELASGRSPNAHSTRTE